MYIISEDSTFYRPGEIVDTLLNHFDNRYKKTTRGVITIIVGIFNAKPQVIAGIGNTPFLCLDISDTLILNVRMPIDSVDVEYVGYTITIQKCPKSKSKRKKENLKRRELMRGMQRAQSPRPSAFFPNSSYFQNWNEISFELNHPDSIFRAEYYIDKIISAVRRKIKRRVGYCDPFDTITLRNQRDTTNLIDFATSEWEKLLLKRKKQKKCRN